MFDIAFSELIVIGVIALIVLGPERLPKAARTVGLWVGKAKQGFNSIKTEIDRELKIQEIQQQLAEQKAKLEQQMGVEELKSSFSDAQQDLNSIAADTTSASDKIASREPATPQKSKRNNDPNQTN